MKKRPSGRFFMGRNLVIPRCNISITANHVEIRNRNAVQLPNFPIENKTPGIACRGKRCITISKWNKVHFPLLRIQLAP